MLGAVEMAGKPLTVPQIARRMGLARQSVHATVGVLLAAGLVERARNDDHRRSPLVAVTALGHDAYRSLEKRQAAWVGELAAGLPLEDLRLTGRSPRGSAAGSRTPHWSRPTSARDRPGPPRRLQQPPLRGATEMTVHFIEMDERVPFLSQLDGDLGPVTLINRF